MPEERLPISSSRLTAVDAARHSFTTVRRGFDPHEVRAYLDLVARELTAWEQRYEEMRATLAEAEERARHPEIDEATLAQALGQQSAQILRHAHEEAARIVQQAEEEAAAALRQAHQQATEVAVRAESAAAERVAEAELAATSVQQRASEEADALAQAARHAAENIHEEARQQGRSMIEQAHEARRRVLADLAQRRRAVTLQIEQFRAARDQVASSIVALRREVDRILSDLARADDEARAAAAEVARRGVVVAEGDLLTDAEVAGALAEGETPPPPSEAGGGAPNSPGLASAEVLSEPPLPPIEAPAAPGAPLGEEPPAAPEPPEEEPGGSGGSWGAQPSPTAPDSVEGLFARLRAGQETGAGSDPSLSWGAGPDVTETLGAAGSPLEVGVPKEDEADLAGGQASVTPEPSGGGVGEAERPVDAEEPEGGPLPSRASSQETSEEPGPDDRARTRRAELLDPVVVRLARRLKRALQDDQNEVLDRLRGGDGHWSSEVLGPEKDHREAFASAALPFLEEAVKAGLAFPGGRPPRASGADRQVAGDLAESLAGTVVTLLRRRLADGEAADDEAVERVGAAYREWRGERIERLVGDYALDAFSSGVLRAAGRSGHVRWVLAGGGGDCADCEDNALAESLAAGTEFPTGHRHPPAHAGCRCLVVPTAG